MKKHTQVYMRFFGYKIPEDCFCEICGKQANDIHHIQARGLGGNPKGDKDDISNIMALCRAEHLLYGDVPGYKTYLRSVHLKFMAANKK